MCWDGRFFSGGTGAPIFHVCAARAAPSRIVAGFLDASGSVTTKAGAGPADQPRHIRESSGDRATLIRARRMPILHIADIPGVALLGAPNEPPGSAPPCLGVGRLTAQNGLNAVFVDACIS